MAGRTYTSLAGSLAAALALAVPASAATIEVTTTNDELDLLPDATCSLREAVDAAQGNAAIGGCPKGQAGKTDTIELAGETYELDIPTTDEDLNLNGDLDFSGGGPLKISGAGQQATQITTSLDDRILNLDGASGATTLVKLEVSGGDSTQLSVDDGGNIRAGGGKLVLRKVTSLDSFAQRGGAIQAENQDSQLILDRTTISDAQAESGGGLSIVNDVTLKVRKSVFISNLAYGSINPAVEGGAIASGDGPVTISDSSFVENTAFSTSVFGVEGGAIDAGGPLTIKRALFAANDAEASLSEDEDEEGGAIHFAQQGAKAEIENSTFVDNTAADEGGALWMSNTTVTHSTFLGNSSAEGDHLFLPSTSGTTLKVSNSIIPSSLIGDACGAGNDPLKSRGYNVFNLQDPDCPVKATDEVVSDVGLDPGGLEDNGGPTETIGLEKESEAVDLIPESRCPNEDQRGFDRPKGPRCDAGAVERGAKP